MVRIDATWLGSAGPTFYDNAPASLSKQANGSVSYLGPGDIVVINVFYNGVADGGHALVVNSGSDVSSGTVNLVSQNSGYDTSTLPVVPGTISNGSVTVGGGGSGYTYTTIGVVHAPKPAVASTPISTAPTKVSNGVVYLSLKNPTPVFDPVHVVLDGGDLFVDWLGESTGEIAEYNANTGVEIRVIHDSGYIASSGADIWVLGSTDGTSSITEINAGSGAVVQVITAPDYNLSGADAISATSNDVWIASSGPSVESSNHKYHTTDNSLTEVSASTGALIQVLSAPSLDLNFPWQIEADGTYVWVANHGGNSGSSITELNSVTGALNRVIRGPIADLDSPNEMTSDVSDLWVITVDGANRGVNSQVDEFSATTGKLVRVLHDDVEVPEGIANDGAHLWLSNDFSGNVTEYSNATGALIRLIPHSEYQLVPQAIAASASRIWVANAYGENGRYRVYGIPTS